MNRHVDVESGGLSRTTLPSGLRVVTETLPALRSVSIGFWVDCGSRDESPELAGASHFLEHLLFKGTQTRSAEEITRSIESVGGDTNAFTSHEYTVYYIRVPSDHVDMALDVLCDIIWNPAFRTDEIENERQVILEELRMREDMPDEAVHELAAGGLFPEHALGNPVGGTIESVTAMTREQIAGYHDEFYFASNIVVAAAGYIDHETIVEGIQSRFAGKVGKRPERALTAFSPPVPLRVQNRTTEQAHTVLSLRSITRDDPDRHALSVLNQALGGGMSSRLFQEVREKRGLAYSVYSYRSGYQDGGALGVYLGSSPDRIRAALDVVYAEVDRLVSGGITDDEIAAAKGHLRGSVTLGLEGSAHRMHRIGRSELIHNEVPELDEVVERIEKVTPDDVTRVINRIFVDPIQSLAVVGTFTESDFSDAQTLTAAG